MTIFISPLQMERLSGERVMLLPLIDWLTARRWVRSDSIVVEELPVSGRRVDLSVLTRSGSLSAFELKMGGFGRALEQGYYNRRHYDRSWIVLDGNPRLANLEEARSVGVGVLISREGFFEVAVQPGVPIYETIARRRVAERIRERAYNYV